MAREFDPARRRLLVIAGGILLKTCAPGGALEATQQNISTATSGRRRAETTPLPTPTQTPEQPKFQAGNIVMRGDPKESNVYLTVDDCWDAAQVATALRVAKAADVQLTFFPAGQAVQRNPDVYKRMVAEGHSIQNHTLTHPDLTRIPDSGIRREIELQQAAVRRAVGSSYTQQFLRPPYGAYDARVIGIAKEYGLQIALWTADSQGYTFPETAAPATVEKVVGNALRIVPNSPRDSLHGRIVLQHAVVNDMAALPIIIQQMQSAGMRPLAMPQGIK
jgi:peptidoglycan-N-acetylmuramic acid deacetylase